MNKTRATEVQIMLFNVVSLTMAIKKIIDKS